MNAVQTEPSAGSLADVLAVPADAALFAIRGAPGSGKSVALVRRATMLSERTAGAVLLSAASPSGVARLRRDAGATSAVTLATLPAVALAAIERRHIDDATAAAWFSDACASLFALEWPEIAAAQIDPEITGLASPQRFAAAAFRLIRKLRGALIDPETFRAHGLRGATEFYAKPPNFAGSALLLETNEKYRDSLRVTPAELERQRAREVDLVLVLTNLYHAYEGVLAERTAASDVDALYLAARLQTDALRGRFAYGLIDDAQDLTVADYTVLQAIFGPELRGVTFAGDPDQATRGFAAGGRGAEAFARAGTTIVLAHSGGRAALPSAAAARILTGSAAGPLPAGDGLVLYRATDARDEARFVAAQIRASLERGTAPGAIAIVANGLTGIAEFVDALLDAQVPCDLGGAADLFEFRAVLDTLGAAWAAVDPFRHDYLLRNLEAPWLALSDASIAILCGEARSPQARLFELPDEDEEDEARAHRWDRARDVRLARNVTRGDVDAQLGDDARERIRAFRAARSRWESLGRTLGPAAQLRAIAAESTLASLSPGARRRFDAGLVARLLERADAFERGDPLATLEDFLCACDREADSDLTPAVLERRDAGAVAVLDIEAAKGEWFDDVYLIGASAGSWPRYYTPDAFLFAPKLGMIAKENAGDGSAVRTVKFTYEMFRSKFREKYCAEGRRAFYTAAVRARERLTVSAWGRATKGKAAPEFLAELERGMAARGDS